VSAMAGERAAVYLPGLVTAARSFGQVQRSRTLRDMSVEEVLMPRGIELAAHGHEDAQLCFVLEGEYLESARGRAWRLQPGTAWLRPAREQHSNIVAPDQDALTLLVSFNRERFGGCERADAGPRLVGSLLLDELRAGLIGELRRDDAGTALALEGWALLLLTHAERAAAGLGTGTGAAPPWLRDARQVIEQSYRTRISLASVAASLGVHPATLAAAFRRYYQVSVGEIIRELRLRHARQRLRASRAPIKQIAVEAGFYDQAHLGRCCKRRFGLSPGEIRRR
jgi:AraC family transcriptional regulator